VAKKSFTPAFDQVSAAEAVFACMAMVATVRPIVEAYQSKILRDLGWGHLPLEQTYTMPDAVFQVYHERCKEARDLALLVVEEPEFCPLLVAGHLLILAEHAMVDSMAPITGLTWDKLLCSRNGLQNLREYTDLTLRLLAPFCKGRL
jgi:hypothetical protein